MFLMDEKMATYVADVHLYDMFRLDCHTNSNSDKEEQTQSHNLKSKTYPQENTACYVERCVFIILNALTFRIELID